VRAVYQTEGEFKFESLYDMGIIDKDIFRDMCETSVMVDGSRYTGQFKKDSLIKGKFFVFLAIWWQYDLQIFTQCILGLLANILKTYA